MIPDWPPPDRVFSPPWDTRKRAELEAAIRFGRDIFGNVWIATDHATGVVTVSVVEPPSPQCRQTPAVTSSASR